MIEIKYKAWYKPLGVMIEPENLVKIELETKVLGVYMEMDNRGYHELRMYDFEMMQYTGLKDKNGREIYEGDVFPPGERTRGEVTIVCYDSKQLRYKAVPLSLYKANAGNGGWTGFDLNPFSEVIGNIYENPELIGGDPQ